MAYDDIYIGLTDEEKEQMIKADIPKAVVVGSFKMSEEEKKEADMVLQNLISRREKAIKEKRGEKSGK